MRALVATVVVALIAAVGMAVAATATATKNGLPAYTDGYSEVAQAEPEADDDTRGAQRRQERLREPTTRRRTGASRTAL